MAEAGGREAAVARVRVKRGRTVVALPEGIELGYALYSVRREGSALILEPVTEGPRAAGMSPRLDFDGRSWLVAGTRMPAAALLEMMAHGATPDGIVAVCPHLALADLRACLALGAELTGRRIGEGL